MATYRIILLGTPWVSQRLVRVHWHPVVAQRTDLVAGDESGRAWEGARRCGTQRSVDRAPYNSKNPNVQFMCKLVSTTQEGVEGHSHEYTARSRTILSANRGPFLRSSKARKSALYLSGMGPRWWMIS